MPFTSAAPMRSMGEILDSMERALAVRDQALAMQRARIRVLEDQRRVAMKKRISMTFEASPEEIAKAGVMLFEQTPFGLCIEVAAVLDHPAVEALRPDDASHASPSCMTTAK